MVEQFRAIQLSVMAEHIAAARMATESALATGNLLASIFAVHWPTHAAMNSRDSSRRSRVHSAIGCDRRVRAAAIYPPNARVAHGSESNCHRVVGRSFLASRQPTTVDLVLGLCAGMHRANTPSRELPEASWTAGEVVYCFSC